MSNYKALIAALLIGTYAPTVRADGVGPSFREACAIMNTIKPEQRGISPAGCNDETSLPPVDFTVGIGNGICKRPEQQQTPQLTPWSQSTSCVPAP